MIEKSDDFEDLGKTEINQMVTDLDGGEFRTIDIAVLDAGDNFEKDTVLFEFKFERGTALQWAIEGKEEFESVLNGLERIKEQMDS